MVFCWPRGSTTVEQRPAAAADVNGDEKATTVQLMKTDVIKVDDTIRYCITDTTGHALANHLSAYLFNKFVTVLRLTTYT